MKRLKLKTIKSKVLGIFLSITLIIFIIVGIIVTKYTSDIMFANTKDKLATQSSLATEQVDKFFSQRTVLVNQMETNKDIINFMNSVQSRDTVKTDPNYQNVVDTLIKIRKTDPELSLVWIALEKASYLVGDVQWEPPATWNIHERPWYNPTIAKKGLLYTEPYKDSGTGEMVVSAIKPIYDKNNQFLGVVGIDIRIDSLPAMMSQYKIGDNGYLILASSDGLAIYHPDESQVLKTNVKDVGTFGSQMIQGKTGFETYTYNGAQKYIAYQPVPSTGWSVGAIIPESDVFKDYLKIQRITIIIYLISIIFLFAVLSYTINRVLKNIPYLVTSIGKIADGDLTVKVDLDTEDEIGLIGKAINNMGHNFQEVIGKVVNSSSHITDSSEKLTEIAKLTLESSENVSKTVQEIAEGASNQAKDTQLGSDRALGLGEIVDKDLKYMNEVNESSKNVISLIDDGLNIIKDLTKKTDESDSAIKEVYEGILKTNESAGRIGDASQIITSIAEQTNLLALNAAIEAARAGENGKGFAVVADEIRKLAEQSTNSTKIIDAAVSKLQSDSSVSVRTIENVLRIIEDQAKSVEFTKKQYTEISGAISDSQGIIEMLSSSLDEMNKRKNEILNIMEGLSSISQENAASSEEVAATTEEQTLSMGELTNSSSDLSELAQDLQRSISKFKI